MHVADFLLRCFITCGPPPAVCPKASVPSRDARKLLKVLCCFIKSSIPPNPPQPWEEVQCGSRMDIYCALRGTSAERLHGNPPPTHYVRDLLHQTDQTSLEASLIRAMKPSQASTYPSRVQNTACTTSLPSKATVSPTIDLDMPLRELGG